MDIPTLAKIYDIEERIKNFPMDSHYLKKKMLQNWESWKINHNTFPIEWFGCYFQNERHPKSQLNGKTVLIGYDPLMQMMDFVRIDLNACWTALEFEVKLAKFKNTSYNISENPIL